MELKRLIAEDSKSALQNVRTTYGEDALIVSTNKIGTKTEVICAVDLQPDNATFEEDLATVAPTAASKEQAAPFSATSRQTAGKPTYQRRRRRVNANATSSLAPLDRPANDDPGGFRPRNGTRRAQCQSCVRLTYKE